MTTKFDKTLEEVLLQSGRGNLIRAVEGLVEANRLLAKQIKAAQTNKEDAEILQRVKDAPERRVFYVDVGDLSPTEAKQLVDKVMDDHKKTPKGKQILIDEPVKVPAGETCQPCSVENGDDLTKFGLKPGDLKEEDSAKKAKSKTTTAKEDKK